MAFRSGLAIPKGNAIQSVSMMFTRKLILFSCAALLCAVCSGTARSPTDSGGQTSSGAACCRESTYVTLPVIYFSSNSTVLDASAIEKLDRLRKILGGYDQMKLLVVGHTDSQGSVAYNQALSQRRASAVVDYLISRGIDSERLERAAHSESQPMATNASANGRAENRRVVFIEH